MLALVFAALASPPDRLPPIDQCTADHSFVAFRTELMQILARRDAQGLLRIVADDVHASLGGDVGKRDFIALWDLQRPRSSKVWGELGTALQLGCTIRGGIATVPSLGGQVGDLDPFETFVAMPGARLRARPHARARLLGRLDWHVLAQVGTWDGGPWLHVRLVDGRSGYVFEPMVRSPIGYRAWFEKRGGRWVMAGFLAGD